MRSREEARAIASSAARALKGYRTDAALRSTENAEFDIADFVNGGPFGVRADTIYITARSDEQELVAPLVVGILDQIQRAIYKRHRRLEAAGLIEQPGAAPILFALDELYGLAPLPNLPHILSEGGSQGLLIAAAIQDLSLIESRWKDEAGAFMTMFGHVLVYPGIRDVKTLEAISKLAGSYDHRKRDANVKKDIHPDYKDDITLFSSPADTPTVDQEESARLSSERRPRLDPHEVMLGVDPRNHDKLIHFSPRGVGTVRATPYYRAAPWPMLLTAYLERAHLRLRAGVAVLGVRRGPASPSMPARTRSRSSPFPASPTGTTNGLAQHRSRTRAPIRATARGRHGTTPPSGIARRFSAADRGRPGPSRAEDHPPDDMWVVTDPAGRVPASPPRRAAPPATALLTPTRPPISPMATRSPRPVRGPRL